MKARKMWVERLYLDGKDCGLYETPASWMSDPAPVLVTDATEMPDFEPGDRVQAVNTKVEGEVETVYRNPRNGKWQVLVDCPNGYRVFYAQVVTKLPHEKTVVLRVTGPEEHVERVAHWMHTTYEEDSRGVRVERVEDEG